VLEGVAEVGDEIGGVAADGAREDLRAGGAREVADALARRAARRTRDGVSTSLGESARARAASTMCVALRRRRDSRVLNSSVATATRGRGDASTDPSRRSSD